jgi:hypothetical protein
MREEARKSRVIAVDLHGREVKQEGDKQDAFGGEWELWSQRVTTNATLLTLIAPSRSRYRASFPLRQYDNLHIVKAWHRPLCSPDLQQSSPVAAHASERAAAYPHTRESKSHDPASLFQCARA